MNPSEKDAEKSSGYPEFLSSLQLYTIGLSRSSCRINREAYWNEDQEPTISYKLSSKPISTEENHFDVRSTLTLKLARGKAKSPSVWLFATFDLHFHATRATKDFVQRLCESEIRLIVWPYFREYANSMTARMHIPPVILPLSDQQAKP